MDALTSLALSFCIGNITTECLLTDNSIVKPHNQSAEIIRSLNGRHFSVTTLQNEPLSSVIKGPNGEWIGDGVAFTLFEALASHYNFTYEVVMPDDPRQWVLGDNNTGIFRLLKTGKADIAVAFAPVPYIEKHDIVRYSTALDTGQWVVMIKRPFHSAESAGIFQPFEQPVWFMIFGFTILMGPFIWAVMKIRKVVMKKNEMYQDETYSFFSCCWFIYSALVKQGSVLNPQTDHPRLIFSGWWLFVVIITAFYTANLTAYLTLSKFKLPIQKTEDIRKYNHDWIARTGGLINTIMDHQVPSVLYNTLKQVKGHYMLIDDLEISEKFVKEKSWIFIRDNPAARIVVHNDYIINKRDRKMEEKKRCTFALTDFPVVEAERAFAYSDTFPYKEEMDELLERFVETGVVKYLTERNLTRALTCPIDLREIEKALYNNDLRDTYYMVIGGYILAVFLCLLENIHYCVHKRDRQFGTPASGSVTIGSSTFRDRDALMYKTPPPQYSTIFSPTYNQYGSGKKKSPHENGYKTQIINGRDYFVFESWNGDKRLVPVRQPSAILFQYTS